MNPPINNHVIIKIIINAIANRIRLAFEIIDTSSITILNTWSTLVTSNGDDEF